ncbi:MAG: PspA/IM30 family protein [Spirochaetia bacterium]
MSDKSLAEQVYHYTLTVKRYTMDIKRLEEEKEKWNNRVSLAAKENRSDLEAEAAVRRDEINQKIEGLKIEREAVISELSSLKRELEMLRDAPEQTVDADLLLEQLNMVVGERDKLADQFREQEAETALEALKRKIADENE